MKRYICILATLSITTLSYAADKNAHGTSSGTDPKTPVADQKPEKGAVVGKVLNPVSLDIAEDGSIFVVETVRYLGKGDFDNRGKRRREDDDQHIYTMADHEAVVQALHKDGDLKTGKDSLEKYLTQHKEKVWKFSDSDGDGTYESKDLFYEGFNTINSGIVAGVSARDGLVHVTAEPEVWSFEDKDNKAANGKLLATGFGIKIGWYGHDLHGLVYGHDGKLYFSMADKAWHVTTSDGRVLTHPNTGGVFRCNPDGSELEEYAIGLRNPQELAIDAFGNLWSGDNNCDAGDKARLVYITEASDHGWRFSHQSMKSRGPWLREKMWEMRRQKDDFLQPAWITPPIAYIGSGPSGLFAYPGLGMPDRYDNYLVVCDFRGGRGNLDAFGMEPSGAGFTMKDFHHIISGPANSSARMGYDGKIYVADWGGGWNLNDRGNIFTLSYPAALATPEVKALPVLSKEDFNAKSAADLGRLLSHPDMRIRQRAHYALARKGDIKTLAGATKSDKQFARLHGVWGLGMIARANKKAHKPLADLLSHQDAEVRAQAARAIGDSGYTGAAESLERLMSDNNARVQFFAIKALGKVNGAFAIAQATKLLAANDNADAYTRDACVFALHRADDAKAVGRLLKHDSAAVRLGAVLALRRYNDAGLRDALSDSDPMVATEAVRAIYDKRIEAALADLAAIIDKPLGAKLRNEAVLRRVVQANLYVGGAGSAKRLVGFMATPEYPEEHRLAAADALMNFDKPSKREQVWGSGWIVERKPEGHAAAALKPQLTAVLQASRGKSLAKAYELARRFKLGIPNEAWLLALKDRSSDPRIRLEAFKALMNSKHKNEAVDLAFKNGDDALKIQALDMLVTSDPGRAVAAIKNNEKAPLKIRQHGVRLLPKIKDPQAAATLSGLVDRLASGELPPELALDVYEAAVAAKSPQLAAIDKTLNTEKPADKLRFALAGGDATRGKNTFYNHQAAQCLRCHKIDRKGGDVGPNLSKVGKDKDAEYLLRSLVDPGAEIAKGYGVVSVTTKDGKTIAGTLTQETKDKLSIKVDKKTHQVKVADIATRTKPVSGMPPMAALLKPGEVRDLLAYLRSRK
jgi:quinoprotein glucose dehydrogenase